MLVKEYVLEVIPSPYEDKKLIIHSRCPFTDEDIEDKLIWYNADYINVYERYRLHTETVMELKNNIK